MKKITLMIAGLSLATAGFCGVAQLAGDGTCHIYHKNKLLKTVTCTYEGAEGASMTYGFTQYTYDLPGFGSMSTSNSVDGFDKNGNATGVTTTVNDEPAIIRYRHPTSKKVVSKKYAQSGKPIIECYLSTKSHWEICAVHDGNEELI